MPTPTPNPFSYEAVSAAAGTPLRAEPTPYVPACHAGQAARAELKDFVDSEAADIRRGHEILDKVRLTDLAEVADDLRCAILAATVSYAKQCPELERADLGALQDVAKLLRNAGRG